MSVRRAKQIAHSAPGRAGRIAWLPALALLFFLVACNSLPSSAGPTSAASPAATTVRSLPTLASSTAGAPTAAATRPAVATEPAQAGSPERALTIFYTNDEHGWMEGMEPGSGAANMMALWREASYEENGPYLILSGGDMWTGAAISSWFEGESMAEVLNAMGYAAAAVGNHEFDFGLEVLRARAIQSDFPFLSANVRDAAGQTPGEWGIEPFTLLERNGIQIGIIGLTTTSTPFTTNPANLRDLQFLEYEAALREITPQARAAGAELLLVAGHLCRAELTALAQAVRDLGIHFMGGGHCNELFTETVAGTVIVGGGYHLTSFARVDLLFDTETDALLQAEAATVRNRPAAAEDDAIAAIVARWQARTAEELDVVVGYSERGLPRYSDEMLALVTESWLWAYPTADVAITNRGGFRAALPRGEITFGDIVSAFPFNNVIVDVELRGDELLRVLAHGNAAVGGARLGVGEWILKRTGEPIRRDAVYHVLVNDFMYAGGDNYGMLTQYDPDAYNTAIDWRQPMIDWMLAQDSGPDAPLDDAFAALAD